MDLELQFTITEAFKYPPMATDASNCEIVLKFVLPATGKDCL